MKPRVEPLFYLNEDETVRLSTDGIQWILEKGRPERAIPGKDTGYRGVSFVTSGKHHLLWAIQDKSLEVDLQGRYLLAALDPTFKQFQSDYERSGRELKLAKIHRLARQAPPLPERLVVNPAKRRARVRQYLDERSLRSECMTVTDSFARPPDMDFDGGVLNFDIDGNLIEDARMRSGHGENVFDRPRTTAGRTCSSSKHRFRSPARPLSKLAHDRRGRNGEARTRHERCERAVAKNKRKEGKS